MTYFSILFYGPIYFQVTGLFATQAGLRLLPSSVGLLLGSITTGVIMRWIGIAGRRQIGRRREGRLACRCSLDPEERRTESISMCTR